MKYEFCRVTSEKAKLQLNCNATRQGKKVRHGIFVFVNPTRSRVTFCVDAFSNQRFWRWNRFAFRFSEFNLDIFNTSPYFSYISSIYFVSTFRYSNETSKSVEIIRSKELPDSGLGTQNMERIQKLTERIEKAEEDAGNQVGKTSAELQTYKL